MFLSLTSESTEDALMKFQKKTKPLPSNDNFIFDTEPNIETPTPSPQKQTKFQNLKERLLNLDEIRIFKKKPKTPVSGNHTPVLDIKYDDAFILTNFNSEKEDKNKNTSHDKFESMDSFGISGIKDVGTTIPSNSDSDILSSAQHVETLNTNTIESKSSDYDIFSMNQNSKFESKIDLNDSDSFYSFTIEQEEDHPDIHLFLK
eukprot:gene12074-5567_t